MASKERPGWTRPAAISVGVGVCAYAVSYLFAPTYLAYFTLYFPNVASSPSFLTGVRNTGENDQSVVRNFGGAITSPLVASGSQTATGIVESMTCAREVARKLDLARKWGLSEDQAAKRFRAALSTSTEKSGFLRVDFVGEPRDLCESALKGVYEHLGRRASELTVNVSRKNREFVEDRYDQAKTEADRAQSALTDLLARSRLAAYESVSGKYMAARQALDESKVQETVSAAVLDLGKRQMAEMIRLSRTSPAGTVTMGSVNSMLASIAGELQAKRQKLETAIDKFTDASPEVQVAKRDLRLTERIASELLTVQETALRKGYAPEFAKAHIELETLRITSRENEKLLARYGTLIGVSARETSALERAKADFKTATDQMARLRGELEIARIAEERDPSRFELVDPPQTEPDPVGPRRAFMAGIAFLLAMAVQIWPLLASKMREAGA